MIQKRNEKKKKLKRRVETLGVLKLKNQSFFVLTGMILTWLGYETTNHLHLSFSYTTK